MLPAFAFSADWHLPPRPERGAWARHPGVRGDAQYALSQIVDYCLENKLDLLAGGDLTDVAVPDTRIINFLLEKSDRLTSAGRRLIYIQGDHDKNIMPALALRGRAEHLHASWTEVGDFRVAGLDYQLPENLVHSLNELPRAEVLLCHQKWREFLGGVAATDGSLTELTAPFQVVLTGDYHKSIDYHLPSGRVAISSGSTCLQAVDEDTQKSFVVVYRNLDSWKRVPLKSRRVAEFLIRDAYELEKCLHELPPFIERQEGVPEEIATGIVWVRAALSVKDAYRHVAAAVGDWAHLFFDRLRQEEEGPPPEDDATEEELSGAEACLDKVCKSTRVRDGVLRLYRSTDTRRELDTMEKEHTET